MPEKKRSNRPGSWEEQKLKGKDFNALILYPASPPIDDDACAAATVCLLARGGRRRPARGVAPEAQFRPAAASAAVRSRPLIGGRLLSHSVQSLSSYQHCKRPLALS